MEYPDRLDAVIAKLTEQLRQNQKLERQAVAAIESLQKQIELLDRAKVVVVNTLAAGEAAAIKAATPKRQGSNEKGLQEVVLQCVNEADEAGATPAEVTARVKSLGHESVGNQRSLYSSVYVSLLRLVTKGEITKWSGPRGKVFRKVSPTKPLFPNGKGQSAEAQAGSH